MKKKRTAHNYWKSAFILFFLILSLGLAKGDDYGNIGSFKKWQKVEINFNGPSMNGNDNSAGNNPFRDVSFNVTFSGPGGQSYKIPGFFAGDGNGGQAGSVWQVRFSADAIGAWTFSTTSSNALLNGHTGSFNIVNIDGSEEGFYRLGRLKHEPGKYYLRFGEGKYWIKGGSDDPEFFLTESYGNLGFKKSKIDYLVSRGINSQYIMTNKVGGDSPTDAFPWISSSSKELFNISKLEEWEELFDYMNRKEVLPHLVFLDDAGSISFNHALYYRELIARFGYLPALVWNIGEEANEAYGSNGDSVKANAGIIEEYDKFNHPLTVHGEVVDSSFWNPYFGDGNFDITSFQAAGLTNLASGTLPNFNQETIDFRARVVSSGRIIPISWDETPRVMDNSESTRSKFRKEIVWPIYIGGGNFEFHYHTDYVNYEQLGGFWDDLARARRFIESLPFYEMAPDNSLVSAGIAFAKQGEAYAVYLSSGGSVNVNLNGVAGSFDARWFNPRDGSYTNIGSVSGGGSRSFNAPDANDWALYLNGSQKSCNELGGILISLPECQGKICDNDSVYASDGLCCLGSCINVITENCTDSTKNQDETGVDCGGVCVNEEKKCGNGNSCRVNGDCVSNNCAGGVCTALGNVPIAPSNLVVNLLNGIVSLFWSDNSGNEENFIVQRSADGVTWSNIVTLPADSVSYNDSEISFSPGEGIGDIFSNFFKKIQRIL